MTLDELKCIVLTLPQEHLHEFVVWVNKLGEDYGDVTGRCLDQLAAEIWDQDDRRVPPNHPAA
jgi:hypothetical protein